MQAATAAASAANAATTAASAGNRGDLPPAASAAIIVFVLAVALFVLVLGWRVLRGERNRRAEHDAWLRERATSREQVLGRLHRK